MKTRAMTIGLTVVSMVLVGMGNNMAFGQGHYTDSFREFGESVNQGWRDMNDAWDKNRRETAALDWKIFDARQRFRAAQAELERMNRPRPEQHSYSITPEHLEMIVNADLATQLEYAMNGKAREFYVEYLEARFPFWRAAADHGIPAGQCLLGDCCYLGFAGPQSDREAFLWYAKAARQGFLPAITEIGCYFLNGTGVDRDVDEGLALLRLAADNDYMIAKLYLAALSETE